MKKLKPVARYKCDFGNLQLKDIVKETHLDKVSNYLKTNGYKRESVCENVANEIGNYHIYDIPRLMVICGEDKMNDFIEFLKANNLVGVGFEGRVGLTYELINKREELK